MNAGFPVLSYPWIPSPLRSAKYLGLSSRVLKRAYLVGQRLTWHRQGHGRLDIIARHHSAVIVSSVSLETHRFTQES